MSIDVIVTKIITLHYWVGPSDAIEGYVPRRDRTTEGEHSTICISLTAAFHSQTWSKGLWIGMLLKLTVLYSLLKGDILYFHDLYSGRSDDSGRIWQYKEGGVSQEIDEPSQSGSILYLSPSNFAMILTQYFSCKLQDCCILIFAEMGWNNWGRRAKRWYTEKPRCYQICSTSYR
jgi:hypothetical protein